MAVELLLGASSGSIAGHRPSRTRGARHLSAFKGGEIALTGDHNSLVEKGGVSSQLAKRPAAEGGELVTA
jgi:hypothetical protein